MCRKNITFCQTSTVVTTAPNVCSIIVTPHCQCKFAHTHTHTHTLKTMAAVCLHALKTLAFIWDRQLLEPVWRITSHCIQLLPIFFVHAMQPHRYDSKTRHYCNTHSAWITLRGDGPIVLHLLLFQVKLYFFICKLELKWSIVGAIFVLVPSVDVLQLK